MRREFALLLCLAGVACLGCEREVFRAETRMMADGSIVRTVYQPSKRTSEAARAGKVWTSMHRVNAPPDNETSPPPLSALLKQAPHVKGKPGPEYFLATGQFANVQAIPDSLEFEAPRGLPKGHLVRKLDRVDLGLVTQWTWEETLTDVVNPKDHRAARQELATILIDLTVSAAGDVWGPEYDLTELKQWLLKDGIACVNDLGDLILEHGVRKELQRADPAAFAEFDLQCARIWQRYGIDFFDAEGKLMETNAREKPIREFVEKNVQQRVRNKKGQPITPAEIKQVTDGFLTQSVGQSTKASSAEQFGQAWERAATARFGNTDKADAHVNRLGTQVFGLYVWPLLRGPQTFSYEMTYPGVVIVTNGELVEDGIVRWAFPAAMAFPFGFTMRAVVAVPNADALRRHFPKAKLDSRKAVTTYLDAVRKDATLLPALLSLINNGDSSGWEKWQSEPSGREDVLKLLNPDK